HERGAVVGFARTGHHRVAHLVAVVRASVADGFRRGETARRRAGLRLRGPPFAWHPFRARAAPAPPAVRHVRPALRHARRGTECSNARQRDDPARILRCPCFGSPAPPPGWRLPPPPRSTPRWTVS